MARSLWKGKIFIKEFIAPGYRVESINYLKHLKFLKSSSPTKQLDELKIYRRNHVLLNSQIPVIRSLPDHLLYNGYDFIKRSLPPSTTTISETPIFFNLGSTVMTREMRVTHKIKLSKGSRKNNLKLKKRSSVIAKSNTKNSIVKKKVSLTKTIKKVK